MTKKTYGNKEKDIDTSLFRQSIAVYLKHIHGLRDDSFQYAHVNRNLTVKQKVYIKKVGCAPQTVTYEDYYEVSPQYLSSGEKCHICVIVMETKSEIELTYLSRAISQYLNQ